MEKNMGTIDRIVRIILAVLFVSLYLLGITSGALGIVLMVFSGVFVITSFVSFCPIYALFGLTTCKKEG